MKLYLMQLLHNFFVCSFVLSGFVLLGGELLYNSVKIDICVEGVKEPYEGNSAFKASPQGQVKLTQGHIQTGTIIPRTTNFK